MPFGGPGSYRRQVAPSIEQILVQFNTSSVNFPLLPASDILPGRRSPSGGRPSMSRLGSTTARATTPARRSIELYIQLSPK